MVKLRTSGQFRILAIFLPVISERFVRKKEVCQNLCPPTKPHLDASMTINDNHSKVSTVTLILAEQNVLYGPVQFMEKGMQNQYGAESSFLRVSV